MSATANQTKSERNKANYLAAKEAFNNKNLNECLQFYSEGHEVKSSHEGRGRHVIQHFFEAMHEMWGELTITVEHVVAENNWVMGRSMAVAVHSKAIMGMNPTNKQIVASFWDLHLFNDEGLIVETWNLIDNAAIMKQIGLLK